MYLFIALLIYLVILKVKHEPFVSKQPIVIFRCCFLQFMEILAMVERGRFKKISIH